MGRGYGLGGVTRAVIVLLCCLSALPGQAEDTLRDVKEPPAFTDWPRRTVEGFLWKAQDDPLFAFVVKEDTQEEEREEFIHIDRASGQYIYLSGNLAVHIRRFSGRYNKKTVIWYMADIRFAAPNHFRAFSADPARPSRAQDKPAAIARRNRVVYAQNGDLFSFRLYNKERVGLIIRAGKVLREDTYSKPVVKIPPLDELALYPDGRMEMRTPGQWTAQAYLDSGAMDVLAFGPILLRDGVKDDRLELSFAHSEPRSALGVVAPGHFIGIMAEGRNDRSAGVPLRFVADRLLEAGCANAFTLDGGQTAAMMFLGEYVMDPGTYNGFHNVRRQQDIVGIGFSEAVAAP